jgi:hypothetical protein
VVVQTGDQLDRGDDEPDILALLERLQREARAAGGDVIVLNGNHELMNVAGDFRYVTPDGFADYETHPATQAAQGESAREGRARAFAPGGPVAQRLARRPISARVGTSLFVHGGVLGKHVDYGLSRLDHEVGQWMMGARPEPPAIVVAEDAPIWTRVYSDGVPTEAACAELSRTLRRVGAARLIVGHTVQRGGITSACGQQVWRIDVGLARTYGGRVEVLEIRGPRVTALKGARVGP